MFELRQYILLGLLALTACATDESKPPESNLEYLNGNKYRVDAPLSVGGIPIGGTLQRVGGDTAIRGRVKTSDARGLYQKGIRFVQVSLVSADTVLATTTTDMNGEYSFSVTIPDGRYRLVVDSGQFTGFSNVDVRGYENDNIDIVVNRR